MPLPPALAKAWDQAEQNLGVAVDIGRNVVCDGCLKDHTDSPEQGGFIVGSYAYGPCCAARIRSSMAKYGEESQVRLVCPAGKPFADFVRDYRGTNNTIRITRRL